jgi:hypothetical protein
MRRTMCLLFFALAIHVLALGTVAWACSDHVPWPYATAPALPYGQPQVRCYTITQQGQVFTYCR